MEESYAGQLWDIVGRMPAEPCLVGMIPTIPIDQAAALASDVAQTVGPARRGHTILTTFEPFPARLDHEIGLEACPGLSDVLGRRATPREVAGHGRARGFIYMPAGTRPAPGEALLRSAGWRQLSMRALRGGGTILAFVPSHVFEAVMARRGADQGTARFDALLWLGSAMGDREGVRRAAIASGAVSLGGLELPGRDRAPDAERRAEEEPAAPGETYPRRSVTAHGERVTGWQHAPSVVVSGPRNVRRRRTSQGRLDRAALWIFGVLIAVAGVAFVYFGLIAQPRTGDPPSGFAIPDDPF